jgi:hypothetical protein
MPDNDRIVLVHLNVIVPHDDPRDKDQIGEAVSGAIEVGSDNDSLRTLHIEVALCDEIA